MEKANFSDDFKRDAVAQITERGYPVAEVSQRLGVSQHSLYAWKRKFAQPSGDDGKDAEIRHLAVQCRARGHGKWQMTNDLAAIAVAGTRRRLHPCP